MRDRVRLDSEVQAEGVELDTVLLQILEHVREKAEQLVTA